MVLKVPYFDRTYADPIDMTLGSGDSQYTPWSIMRVDTVPSGPVATITEPQAGDELTGLFRYNNSHVYSSINMFCFFKSPNNGGLRYDAVKVHLGSPTDAVGFPDVSSNGDPLPTPEATFYETVYSGSPPTGLDLYKYRIADETTTYPTTHNHYYSLYYKNLPGGDEVDSKAIFEILKYTRTPAGAVSSTYDTSEDVVVPYSTDTTRVQLAAAPAFSFSNPQEVVDGTYDLSVTYIRCRIIGPPGRSVSTNLRYRFLMVHDQKASVDSTEFSISSMFPEDSVSGGPEPGVPLIFKGTGEVIGPLGNLLTSPAPGDVDSTDQWETPFRQVRELYLTVSPSADRK